MTFHLQRHPLSVVVGLAVLCSLGSAFTFLHSPHNQREIRHAFSQSSLEPQCRVRSLLPYRSRLTLCASEKGFVEADDMDAIQKLFNKFCDEDGLMTKASLVAMPPFSDMLVSSAQEASLA